MSRPSHSFLTAAVIVAVATVLTQVVQGGSPAPQAPAAPQTVTPPPTPQQPPAPGTAAPAGGFAGGRGAMTNEATDFSPKPPYTAKTPQEEANGFILPTGYRMELVAADPDVISPTLIEFDGNGRMYVGEMISYMMDAERDAASTIRSAASAGGRARRATATTTSTRCSSIISSPRA